MEARFDKEAFVRIFKKKGCNVSATCDAVGITRATFYNHKNDDPTFAAAIGEAEEAVIDMAESKLLKNINDGDNTAIIFFLKTKGKKRGYVENPKFAVNINQDVQGDVVQERKISLAEKQEVARELLKQLQEQSVNEAESNGA